MPRWSGWRPVTVGIVAAQRVGREATVIAALAGELREQGPRPGAARFGQAGAAPVAPALPVAFVGRQRVDMRERVVERSTP